MLSQGQFLVDQPTSMKVLDQFSLLPFNALELKLDYRTAHTHNRTLALILLMLEPLVLVSSCLVHQPIQV